MRKLHTFIPIKAIYIHLRMIKKYSFMRVYDLITQILVNEELLIDIDRNIQRIYIEKYISKINYNKWIKHILSPKNYDDEIRLNSYFWYTFLYKNATFLVLDTTVHSRLNGQNGSTDHTYNLIETK